MSACKSWRYSYFALILCFVAGFVVAGFFMYSVYGYKIERFTEMRIASEERRSREALREFGAKAALHAQASYLNLLAALRGQGWINDEKDATEAGKAFLRMCVIYEEINSDRDQLADMACEKSINNFEAIGKLDKFEELKVQYQKERMSQIEAEELKPDCTN